MTNCYIASYSAYANIVKNIVGDGKLSKLCIDRAGFKAPKQGKNGPNCNMLINSNNLDLVDHKVLHAKVIYKNESKNNELTLLTGNLCERTLDDMNLILTMNINKEYDKKIKKWFNDMNNHLILEAIGSKIIKITQDEFLYKRLFGSIKKVINKYSEDSLRIYIFSPWGSKKFLKNIIDEKRFCKINVYTRQDSNEIWVDEFVRENTINAYVNKDEKVFPHLKCMFITTKKGNEERLVWSEIGSANFTENAIFKDKNIEYIFINEKPDKNMVSLFRLLTKKKNWDNREPQETDDNGITSDEKYGEYDGIEGFKLRNLRSDISRKLECKKIQNCLIDCYKKSKDFKLDIKKKRYTIKVLGFDSLIHTLVDSVDLSEVINVDVPYYNFDPYTESVPMNENDVVSTLHALLWEVDNVQVSNTGESGGGMKEKNDLNPSNAKHINVRFPYSKVQKLSNEQLENKIKTLSNISKMDGLKREYKIMVNSWLPLLNKVREQRSE